MPLNGTSVTYRGWFTKYLAMRRNKITHRCQGHNQLCVLFSQGCAVLFGNRMCSNLWFRCLTLWVEGGYSGNRKSLECDLHYFLKWSLIKTLEKLLTRKYWPATENIPRPWAMWHFTSKNTRSSKRPSQSKVTGCTTGAYGDTSLLFPLRPSDESHRLLHRPL